MHNLNVAFLQRKEIMELKRAHCCIFIWIFTRHVIHGHILHADPEKGDPTNYFNELAIVTKTYFDVYFACASRVCQKILIFIWTILFYIVFIVFLVTDQRSTSPTVYGCHEFKSWSCIKSISPQLETNFERWFFTPTISKERSTNEHPYFSAYLLT